MEFTMKNLRYYATPAILAATWVAVSSSPALASAAAPRAACDQQVVTKVIANHGLTYVVKYGPIVDDNGTTKDATDSFSSSFEGSVGVTVSSSLEASEGAVVASAKETVSASATASVTLTKGHTITYTIVPHTSLHIEYTGKRQHLTMEHYQLSAKCTKLNDSQGDAYVPVGVGWHSWVTKYSG
jgi:hypothetical protein